MSLDRGIDPIAVGRPAPGDGERTGTPKQPLVLHQVVEGVVCIEGRKSAPQ